MCIIRYKAERSAIQILRKHAQTAVDKHGNTDVLKVNKACIQRVRRSLLPFNSI